MTLKNYENQEDNKCPLCNGARVIIRTSGDGVLFEDCSCVARDSWNYRLVRSNVPEKYKDFTLDQLDPNFIKDNKRDIDIVLDYIRNIDSYIKDGVGLFFQSDPGLAKSSLAALIVKDALSRGYTCYMNRMSRFLSLKFDAMYNNESREFVDWIINDVDLLVIEEIEKVYMVGNDNAITEVLIAEFFGELYDSKKSLIITSNIPRTELHKIPYYLLDRFDETVKDVIFVGESFRRSK